MQNKPTLDQVIFCHHVVPSKAQKVWDPHNIDMLCVYNCAFKSPQGVKRIIQFKLQKKKTPLLQDHKPDQYTASGLQVGELEPETIHHSMMREPQCP